MRPGRTVAVISGVAIAVAGLWLLRDRLVDAESAPGVGGSTAPQSGSTTVGFIVRGEVVEPTGAPIAGATVTAGPVSRPTDAQGRFSLDRLPAGDIVIDAIAEGFVSPGPDRLRGVRLTLAGAAPDETTVEGILLTLRRPCQISGRVVAGTRPVTATLGLAYVGAEGLVGPLPPFAIDEVTTSDSAGAFTITDVAPGRLRVVAEATDFAVAESRELYLRDGETLLDVVIDLLPSAVLGGVVRDTEGALLASAEVTVSGGALPHPRRAKTDGRGRFRLDALPAGEIIVRARAAGHRSGELTSVFVDADAPRQVELILEAARGVFGRVIDDTGAGVPHAYVILEAGGDERQLRTDSEGAFTWNDAPDEEMVAIAVSAMHEDSSAQRVRPGREALLRLGPGGHVEGRVLTAAGAPVSQYTIAVETFEVSGHRPYSPRHFRSKTVRRSDGRFELGPLRPGTYYLRAEAPDTAPGSSEPIAVRSAQRTGNVIIRLGRGAAIAGAVTAEDGAAVIGAQVSLFDPVSPFNARTTRTDRDGAYRLQGISTGRHSLRVSARGYLTEISAGVEVPEEGVTWRDVTLTPARSGSGLSFHGIGAVLRPHPRGAEVLKTIDGRPAAVFGLRSGDVIVEVDREPATDIRFDRIIEQIRGEEGVPVELEIEREGEGRFTLEVERGRVVVHDRP